MLLSYVGRTYIEFPFFIHSFIHFIFTGYRLNHCSLIRFKWAFIPVTANNLFRLSTLVNECNLVFVCVQVIRLPRAKTRSACVEAAIRARSSAKRADDSRSQSSVTIRAARSNEPRPRSTRAITRQPLIYKHMHALPINSGRNYRNE